jgi:hypothetical protein
MTTFATTLKCDGFGWVFIGVAAGGMFSTAILLTVSQSWRKKTFKTRTFGITAQTSRLLLG